MKTGDSLTLRVFEQFNASSSAKVVQIYLETFINVAKNKISDYSELLLNIRNVPSPLIHQFALIALRFSAKLEFFFAEFSF